MITYQEFRDLDINHSAIGLAQFDSDVSYYCTPKDAIIIGWAGVDGIHYCTIPQFGEMIFAVNPMNFGDCVHPIARNFEDLLCMLISGVSMDALEQCHFWNEKQFQSFLVECPATEEQKAILDHLQRRFGLTPIENVFSSVKALQAEFDPTQIPYTEDYYDPDMNAAAPVKPAEWRVTFNGGVWSSDGNPGIEKPICRKFLWGEENWLIPSVYRCDEGLVIDYLLEADPAEIKAFIERWDLLNEDSNVYSPEQQEQMEREHPLHAGFYPRIILNGQPLENFHGCGLMWIPESCVPQDICKQEEMKQVIEHYGLDPDRGWAVRRWNYEWKHGMVQDLQSLVVHMERQPDHIAGPHFTTPAVGERLPLTHPVTGEVFVLTVYEVEQQELPEHAFPKTNMEYPGHFVTMCYSMEPDLHDRGCLLQDCAEGDRPRPIKRDRNALEPVATADAAVIGVIGGADGPVAVCMEQRTPRRHIVCSSLHFEPVERVQWRMTFYEKKMDDIEIKLI